MICTIANGCAMRRVRSKMRRRFRHRIAAMRGVPKGDDRKWLCDEKCAIKNAMAISPSHCCDERCPQRRRWSTSKMQHTASDKERSCRVAPPTLVTGWRGQPSRCRDERGTPCPWWCGYRGCQRRFKHHCCTPDEIPCPSLSPSPPAHHLAMQRHAVSISGSTVAAPRWSWRAG